MPSSLTISLDGSDNVGRITQIELLLGHYSIDNIGGRNVFLSDGLVSIITGYHKSQWRIGTRSVARFLPAEVGELLVRYLIYVPFFVRFLHRCMQSSFNPRFLFWEHDRVWSTDKMSTLHKRHTSQLLSHIIRTRDYRHIAVALDRRLMRAKACHLLGVSSSFALKRQGLHADNLSDSGLDGLFDEGGEVDESCHVAIDHKIHSWQTSHTRTTNELRYGNDINLNAGMTDVLLAAYREVSQDWHRVIVQLPPQPSSASRHKRVGSEDASVLASSASASSSLIKRPRMGSRLHVRRELWHWPAIETVLQRLSDRMQSLAAWISEMVFY